MGQGVEAGPPLRYDTAAAAREENRPWLPAIAIPTAHWSDHGFDT